MKASTNLRLIASLVGALALAGCGGGGGGHGGGAFPIGGGTGTGTVTGDGSAIPASALEGSEAFIAFMKGLVATAVDNSEPVTLGDAVVPVSDSAEAANL